jgi:4-hydroxybenzoate polyprenyltransferase
MTSLASVAPISGKLANAMRAADWWEFKVPTFLGVAYAFAYHEQLAFSVLWPLGLLIVLAAVSCAGFVSVINEITDQEADAQAGKRNMMSGRSTLFQAGALGFCLLLGGITAWVMRDYPVSLFVFVLTWLMFGLYSVPPIRLKARGEWGVLADTLGEQVLPALLMACLIAEAMIHEVEWFLAALLTVWSLASGLRGILTHQLRDRENDLAAGIETMATRYGPQAISRLCVWVLYPVEVIALVALLLVFNAPLTWPILALCLLIEMRHGHLARLRESCRAPGPKHWLPLVDYYRVYFPATFILALAWAQPIMLWLLAAHLVFFPNCNRKAAYAIASLLIAPFRGGYAAWHTGQPPKK